MAGEIEYVVGDATAPSGGSSRIIAHVCNDDGGWGKGFVVAVSRRWRGAGGRLPLVVPREGNERLRAGRRSAGAGRRELFVANMIGQHGYRPSPGEPPVRYAAIGTALAALGEHALDLGASVHMPRIGCGLAGGRWELIEQLIDEHLTRRGVAVTVYVYDLQP